jgi:TetR/AcrR family transcriptional repressor of nem operon
MTKMSALMEAGLEKGGIYRHFDSKEQLAAKAFEYAGQAERSRTGRALCCGARSKRRSSSLHFSLSVFWIYVGRAFSTSGNSILAAILFVVLVRVLN